MFDILIELFSQCSFLKHYYKNICVLLKMLREVISHIFTYPLYESSGNC